jgi:hypothetical protein
MKTSSNHRPILAWILIGLQTFLGFGAIVSGGFLMLAPDGSMLQMPLSVMQNSPFSNFFVPGLILFVLLGVFPMGIAYGLLKLPPWRWPDAVNPFKYVHWSWTGSLAAGVMVVIWLSVELIWVDMGFLHILYYVWSGLILVITLLPTVQRYYKRT